MHSLKPSSFFPFVQALDSELTLTTFRLWKMEVSEVTFERSLSDRLPLATQSFKSRIKNVDLVQTPAALFTSEMGSGSG